MGKDRANQGALLPVRRRRVDRRLGLDQRILHRAPPLPRLRNALPRGGDRLFHVPGDRIRPEAELLQLHRRSPHNRRKRQRGDPRRLLQREAPAAARGAAHARRDRADAEPRPRAQGAQGSPHQETVRGGRFQQAPRRAPERDRETHRRARGAEEASSASSIRTSTRCKEAGRNRNRRSRRCSRRFPTRWCSSTTSARSSCRTARTSQPRHVLLHELLRARRPLRGLPPRAHPPRQDARHPHHRARRAGPRGPRAADLQPGARGRRHHGVLPRRDAREDATSSSSSRPTSSPRSASS